MLNSKAKRRRQLTGAELRMPFVSAIAAVVDIVADELVVDADPRVALEASPAATLLGILGEIQVTSEHLQNKSK